MSNREGMATLPSVAPFHLVSDDAKAVGSAWFSLMRPGRGDLTFRMGESRPTARAQAALDELLSAGLIERVSL